MLLTKTNTTNTFMDLVVFKLDKNTYLLVYVVNKFYNIYTYVLGSSIDSLNISFFWKDYVKTNNNLVKYFTTSWRRVVFKGKGFRVRIFRYNKKITLNFGYSHWTKLKFIRGWDLFKLYRQNYLVFCNSWQDFREFELLLPIIKPMNRYTLRGLRFKKQTVKRRFGKISQYISSLH